jgi:hypothetical protein
MIVYPAKVNRTVHYRTAAGKWRPAVITAVTDSDTATLRVGRHGETYATKDRRSGDRGVANANWNDRWRPG